MKRNKNLSLYRLPNGVFQSSPPPKSYVKGPSHKQLYRLYLAFGFLGGVLFMALLWALVVVR